MTKSEIDPETFQIIVKLIGKIVSKYQVKPISEKHKDCMQAGFLGALRGLENYDKSKGKLTTYLWYYIRREIQQFLATQNALTLPSYTALRQKGKEHLSLDYSYDGGDNFYEFYVSDDSVRNYLYQKEDDESIRYRYRRLMQFLNANYDPQDVTFIKVFLGKNTGEQNYRILEENKDFIKSYSGIFKNYLRPERLHGLRDYLLKRLKRKMFNKGFNI